MRNTALVVRGWQVVCVQHCVWHELSEEPAARQAYMHSLFITAASVHRV
jgi:hypothetical protein